ncbi:MAG: hypothetical protein AVDCRST_MAG68-4536 [uncultured Gemmatimonadetes bacterium]|uniref:Glycosyltransferase RgtA/B/C/D-like domain-containing protein n=1 Tax=uncultured Gemmatimonadota bacterium TaxID=203437 RepID=A0A6J4MNC9_9BACT|nr:MAG: hypothetical protein AVDCRST_MAG68-4536 [uncultured Gemmatimonadota bacterium]
MVSEQTGSLRPVGAGRGRVGLLPVLMGIALGAAIPSFAGLLHVWGRHIARPDIQADYLFALVWATLLGAGIFLWPVASGDRTPLLVLWGAKCIVTLTLMLLYEWSYSLDAYGYFWASQQSRPPLGSVSWWMSGRGNVLAGVAWIQTYLLPDSYHALKVTFAMVGLVAVYVFYRAAVLYCGEEKPRLLYVFGLYPSILFWSSILGKDPIQLLGIALYVYGVIGWDRTGRWRYGLPLLAGLLLAVSVRFWAGPILLLPLFALLVLRAPGVAGKGAFLLGGLAAGALVLDRFAARLGLAAMQDFYTTVQNLQRGWEGGSAVQQTVEFTGLGSVLAFLPRGMFTALFRPLPGEVMNPFGLLAGLENLFLVVLLGLAVVRVKWSTLREPLVVWAILLLLTWAAFYGFISSHNMGAAVRFKLQMLPVLLGLLLYLSRRRAPASPARV